MKLKSLVFLALPLLMVVSPVSAQTDEEKGYAIQAEASRRDNGYIDSMHDAAMTLKNAQGEVSTRGFVVKTLEVESDGDKEMGIFHSPADVKGTAVLTFSHGIKPDDQWIYLPSLKRVKRVATVNKSGPFVGSEFAFEDISSWELEKYRYRYLRDEEIDGNDCFVVENIPVYEYSGYTKQIEWLDKKMYQPRKIEFYDRKGALLKTLTFSDYNQYLDRYWRAGKLQMENVQNGKSTELLRKNYRFRNNFSDRDFTENALKNVR
ncbi:MAG: outer membrane lipoprotein-sorting protein [Nitrosomonas sp.]|jgi:outer membrane lipoprotein-sorting protein|uniref:outer membrane lipoprotein-sorting protein n=1 Tax=Nitrosomonas sp. TaxID=42353 RepID=UPI0027267685|nr:outer membrane lipoprotein-sorting protein [Nitrosomonas sp.]MDO9469757.1 outer membrane lipoprotein-sorting protein [Nitrosomonas sp.]MDP1550650.1 outer membrane lipoprotein-sorting protein [Nitrosomonas sp.]MDP2224699.1 outer membrane lipoprotein-sorting protein [Nitrosomonas sp.]MDP3280674.1 outer membrane lipoprotein-sorting protein [Nitrosomonas sp.]MDP3663356.1 outer membrane lipoprotein-sorting protein [Nitrosomonas sp.]